MFKKVKFTTLASIIFTSLLLFPSASHAYTVKSGDSLWKIATEHGVSLKELQQANHYNGSTIYPGQYFKLPGTISDQDKALMARLVHAEAKGEPYAGKVAVATVILNRVDHADFPNSISGVIYETYNNGVHFAFSPVKNGSINQPADKAALKAVNEAIAFRGQGQGSIYFYNPNTAVNNWITTRETTIKIGNHVFAK